MAARNMQQFLAAALVVVQTVAPASAALIGKEDRVIRMPGDLPANVEASQGRMYCSMTGKKLSRELVLRNIEVMKHDIPISQEEADRLADVIMASATLALEEGYVIVSRHEFLQSKQWSGVEPKNCYFELISTGELVEIQKGAYPPVPDASQMVNALGIREQDFAVVKLEKIPAGSSFIPTDSIAISATKSVGDDLTVIANAATNFDGIKGQLEPTITHCKIRYIHKPFDISMTGISNVTSTDCDTGAGSSGSSVWLNKNGKPMFIGVYSAALGDGKDGTEWDVRNHNSIVTTFDHSLIDAYQKLKAMP